MHKLGEGEAAGNPQRGRERRGPICLSRDDLPLQAARLGDVFHDEKGEPVVLGDPVGQDQVGVGPERHAVGGFLNEHLPQFGRAQVLAQRGLQGD